MFDDVCVCIPAYNEEVAIRETLIKLVENFNGAEIIVVDDGSTDSTYEIASAIKGVRVLKHTRNMGYGASLKTAMKHTDRGIVAWYDADGQHRVEDLKNVLEPVLSGSQDAVIGVRAKGSDVRVERVPGKLILKTIAELVARQKVPDLNSGLRAFKKSVVKKYLHLLPNGFSASSTTTMLMIKRGYRLSHVDIMTLERKGVSTVKMFRDGWNTIRLILRILILFEAFNFFALMSFVQIIIGLLYGFYMAFVNGLGFPVLASTILISGIFTFFIGIVCDQVVEMRKERLED